MVERQPSKLKVAGSSLVSRSMGRIGVYILRCSNGRYYTGSTDDIDRRLEEHKRGKSKATRNLLPVEITAFIECKSLSDARSLEHQIKHQTSRKHLEKLIGDYPWNRA